MKSLVFCTSYFESADAWRNRYQRWIEYYAACGFADARLFLIDDCSPYRPPAGEVDVVAPLDDIEQGDAPATLITFAQRLGRSGPLVYPGWWRSFLHSVTLARAAGFEKIIHIESDAFILTPKMFRYIEALDSGWTTFWTAKYKMPETAIQVICKDQFEQMERLQACAASELDGRLAEHVLPFTRVDRDFKGDRYSEIQIRRGILRSKRFKRLPLFKLDFFWAAIPADADFATQVTPRQTLSSGICTQTWQPPNPLPRRF